MKIIFKGEYKSLSDFESENLSDFTIITGKNGSGKTQLIEQFRLLVRAKNKEKNVEKACISIEPDLNKIYTEQLLTEDIHEVNPSSHKDQSLAFHTEYQNLIKPEKLRLIWNNLYKNEVKKDEIIRMEIKDDDSINCFTALISTSEYTISAEEKELILKEILSDKNQNKLFHHYQNKNREAFKLIQNRIKEGFLYYAVASLVANYQGKKFLNLSQSDFLNSVIPEKYYDSNDLIYSKIEKIFYGYLKKRATNSFQYFRKREYEESNNSLSHVEFNNTYQAPWITINEIFEGLHLPYFFPDIKEKDFSEDANIRFSLIKKTSGKIIPFQDLSSGEKVIIGLIIKLFTSKFYNENLLFPDLIIIDEPDAHLHPEMSNVLIKVLEDTFVDKLKIKVIITTHSPSTVALAPKDSIFQLSNDPVCSLKKITKDEALKILTFGVPSFSLNYENRRQVFVESPYDVSFYEKIYQKLSNYLIPEISLSFISSGDSRTDKNGIKVSNCDQVINITDILRKSGNKFIWGIIDWDGKNRSHNFIKVLGNGNRYSIESYLFDPILVSALLFREKIITREQLGLTNNESYIDFKNLGQEQLQTIANFLIDRVAAVSINSSDKTQTKCKLLNGLEINIPIWYLHQQGHDLERSILKAFPELNSIKKGKEEFLKLEIIDKVIDDIHELISIDLLEIFKNVQVI